MFLKIKPINGNEYAVETVYYDTSHAPKEDNAVIDYPGSLPIPEDQPGKAAILKYSETEGLYHEYVDRPLTTEEQFGSLQDENADLMFQNAMQDMSIATLQDENAELMFAIANLQLGGI